MKNQQRVSTCVLLAVAMLFACSRSQSQAPGRAGTGATGANTANSQRLTRYARLLAGVDDPGAARDVLRSTDAFRAHSREMSTLWQGYTTNEENAIQPWVRQQLAPLDHAQTLLYPFAGADFLFAHAFFPRVRTYVLVGLERVGALDNLDTISPANVERELGRVRRTVAPLLQTTFFRTLEMQEDSLHEGLATILATLIAGTGHRLVDARTIGLTSDGRVVDRSGNDPALTAGARIDFSDEGSSEVQSLYYFRADLSNNGLAKQGGVLPFIERLPSKVAFAKAAAYCMHGEPFSVIRNEILRTCDAVLEDDTGIPLRSFDRSLWELRYFGNYVNPIPMFKNYTQADLAQAFAGGKDVLPLTFHVGYGSGPAASNLLLALKRSVGTR